MGETVILTGMVLSVMPIGDYDKRLVILTKERGKITAFAKGARRVGNGFMAASNPFVFGEFELYEGKSAYNLAKVLVKNYFRELTEDIEAAYYGFYFLELASYYAVENGDEKQLLNLLYLSLLALQKDTLDNKLVRRIYELRVLVINGEYPETFCCISCGKKEHLHRFHVGKRGLLCDGCGALHGGRILEESTIYTLQYIISADLKMLFSFKVSEAVQEDLDAVMHQYLDSYLHHHFNSLEILEAMM